MANKRSFFLIVFCALNILFLALYLILSFNNRFSFEDFYFIETLKREGGFFEAVNFYYQNWTGRWMAFSYFYLWFGFVSKMSSLKVLVFFYHVVSISVLSFSVHRIIKICFNKIFKQVFSSLLLLNFSILFCSILYFFSFQIIENWWWICSTFFHIQSVVFLCLAISIIIAERSGLFNYFLLIVSGLYIGASSEVMAALIIVLAPVFVICFTKANWKKVVEFIFSSPGKKVLTLFVLIFLSFISNVFSPGVLHRQQVLEGLSALPKVENKELFRFYDSWDQPAIYVFFRPQYLLCVATLLIAFFASNYFFKDLLNKEQVMRLRKIVIPGSLILIIGSLLITTLVNIYAFKSNLGPLRSWIPASFLWLVSLFVIVFFLGIKSNINMRIRNIGLAGVMSFSVVALGTYLVRQYQMTTTYANSYDKRWEALKEAKLSSVELDKLYPPISSGMLIDTHIDKEKFEQVNLFQ